jgi:hypothetical protein
MTTVKPTVGDVVQVGVAFDARTLDIGIAPMSQTTPTTEHLTGSGTIDPTKDVTFIDVPAGGGPFAFTLGDQTVDGFEKTICSKYVDDGIVITITNFMNGTTMTTFGGNAGGFTLRWDQGRGKWRLAGAPLNYTF